VGNRSTQGKEEAREKHANEPDKEAGPYKVKNRSYKVKNAWLN
jgi:hypothetical protein